MKTLNNINYQLTRKSDNEKFEIISMTSTLIYLVDFDNNRLTIEMNDLNLFNIKSLRK